MLPIVNKKAAHQAMTRHQFLPGVGFLQHASDPDIPAGAKGGKNCMPPAGTKDGSIHTLKTSHGGPDMRMRWIAAERAWASLKPAAGNRLAWTADHLSKAGWEYVGADQDSEGSRRRKRS